MEYLAWLDKLEFVSAVGRLLNTSEGISQKAFDQFNILMLDSFGENDALELYNYMYNSRITIEEYRESIKKDRQCLENDWY